MSLLKPLLECEYGFVAFGESEKQAADMIILLLVHRCQCI